MHEDDIIKDDSLEAEVPLEDDELVDGKKKLLDDDVESVEDLAEEELEIDKEDLMDDVEEF
ncbi:MAG: hypothetical protein Q7R67_02880 [bacterium]|nr:hypothetical protein [bacterium]